MLGLPVSPLKRCTVYSDTVTGDALGGRDRGKVQGATLRSLAIISSQFGRQESDKGLL